MCCQYTIELYILHVKTRTDTSSVCMHVHRYMKHPTCTIKHTHTHTHKHLYTCTYIRYFDHRIITQLSSLDTSVSRQIHSSSPRGAISSSAADMRAYGFHCSCGEGGCEKKWSSGFVDYGLTQREWVSLRNRLAQAGVEADKGASKHSKHSKHA